MALPGSGLYQPQGSGGGSGKPGTGLYQPQGRVGGRPKKKKRGGRGFFGTIGHGFANAGRATEGMIVGTPGFVEAGSEDLVKAAASLTPAGRAWARTWHKKEPPPEYQVIPAIKRDYAYRWGPLFQGHPGRFITRNYETGFVPLALDIGAGVSMVTKGAAAAGVLREAPRALELRLPSGAKVERGVVGSELSRRLKIGTRKALNSLPRDVGKHLEQSAAGRVQRRAVEKAQLGREARLAPYQRATESLDLSLPLPGLRTRNKQLIAANLIRNFVTRENVARYATQLEANGADARTVALLRDPKVLDWVENPTPKMRRALAEGDILTEGLRSDLMAGKLSPEAAEQRRWLPLLLTRGAQMKGKPITGAEGEVGAAVIDAGGSGGKVASFDLEGGTATVRYFATKNGKKGSWTREVPIDELSRADDFELVNPAGTTIPQMIEEIKASLPEGAEPRYVPHMTVPERAPRGYGQGGRVPPLSNVRQNRGFLQAAGRLALNIDSLGTRTLQDLRVALYEDKHAALVEAAPEIHGPLPADWQFVKQSRSDRIGFMERTAGSHEAMLDEYVNLEDPGVSSLGNELTTRSAEEAVIGSGGGRLAIPTSYANKLIGEFSRNDHAVARFLRDTTSVWRALVLNLRVGWLVNNIVGNTLLYAVKNAGPNGLRAYLEAVMETRGPAAVSRLLFDKRVRSALSPEDIAELFPEQAAGTFFGTQTPEAGRVAQLLGHPYSPTRGLRSLDVAYEQALRRAMINRLIRNNPAVKDFYEAMPKQERNWSTAARQALGENATLADRISREVNDALGDFLSMSDFERSVLRGIAPFYGWYRAITLVVAKMPLDSPGRTLILANMGRVGQDYVDDWWRSKGIDPTKLPMHLRSAIPVGGGILRTQGVNPAATVPQLVGGMFAPGQARDLMSLLNPVLFAGPVETARQASAAPWENPQSAARAMVTGYANAARFMPQARLVAPYESKNYAGPHGLKREALQYLGAPWALPNFDEIRRRYNASLP